MLKLILLIGAIKTSNRGKFPTNFRKEISEILRFQTIYIVTLVNMK